MFTEQGGEPELRQAFDRLQASGARIDAAVAGVDLAMLVWLRGEGDSAAEWASRSLELVDGAPPSAGHAHVLAQVARAEMVSGRSEQSLETAARAIELAEASGAEAPRVSALITRATARFNVGEFAQEDFDEALELAQRHDPGEGGRVYVNLGSILLSRGELERATTVAREGLRYAQKMGMTGGLGGFIYGNLCEARFFAGDWEEAAGIATLELQRAARTGGLYYEPFYRFIQAELAAARDETFAGTATVAREIVERGYARADDQTVLPYLALGAWMLVRAGEDEEASELLDRLLDRRRANPAGLLARLVDHPRGPRARASRALRRADRAR